ncbi:MAG: methyltransferase domain-containing protein [Nanoarchaeota archaeon]|nr:methyltransferase domain-containing protein [Nanoarchaeota archaeon]
MKESDNSFYNEKFYKKNFGPSYNSAKIIVPCILKIFKPKSVVDIGCGSGTWLKVFSEEGVKDILGVDFNPSKPIISERNILRHDLRKKLILKRKFDVAISLEVAEHIETKYSDLFVENLTSLSDKIFFSAAIPFQEGENHINEQWHDFWIKKFLKKGYVAIDLIRPKILLNPEVSYDYRQNIFLFIKKSILIKEARNLIPFYEEGVQFMHRKSYSKQFSKKYRFFYRLNSQFFGGIFNGLLDKFLLKRFFGDIAAISTKEFKRFRNKK